MPLVDLPVPQIGEAGFDRAALKWARALKKALNWSVPKGGLLKLRDTPDGFALDLDAPPQAVPFQVAAAVAAGSVGSPVTFTATLLADGTAGALTATGAGTTTRGRNERPYPLLPGLTYWGTWRNGYLYAAAPPPGACRGVTTGAATAATFGGSDGTIAVTITYPDGSTAALTAGYRSTSAAPAGKNCLLVWVPEVSKFYALVDC